MLSLANDKIITSLFYPNKFDLYGFNPVEKDFKVGDIITDEETKVKTTALEGGVVRIKSVEYQIIT